MTEDMMLSIVVPVYNGGEILRESLNGYAEQLTEDMELIFIDDGSTDGSGEICRKICEQYIHNDEGQSGCIRYFRQANQGIAEARNRGIREAKGRYICFFDQDDRAELEVYVKLMEQMRHKDIQMGMCGTGFGREEQWLPYELIPDKIYDAEHTGSLIDSLLLNGFDYPFLDEDIFFYGTVWKCLFVREWIVKEQVAFKAFKSFEDDFLFVLETLLKANMVVCCSQTGYYWNQNIHSESHNMKYDKDFVEKCDAFETYVVNLLSGKSDGYNQGVRRKRDDGHEWDSSYECGLYRSALCYIDLLECLDNLKNSGYDKREWNKVKYKVLQRKKDGLFDEGEHLKKNIIRKRITCQAVSKLPFGIAVFADALLCRLIDVMKGMKRIQALERRRKHGTK